MFVIRYLMYLVATAENWVALACFNANVNSILCWWKRTVVVRGETAWRYIRAIEVENHIF